MAAKPPKPPGNFLRQNNNNNNNNNNTSATSSSATTETNKTCNTSSNNNNTINSCSNNNNNSSNNYSNSTIGEHNVLEENAFSTNPPPTQPPSRPICACTNISIMHLFHEMKQEFPTIPDPIVAQCVNENCHKRENCLQMLRNELALNPIPIQTYPAKVLQQQRQQKLQAQQSFEKPPKPLKPIRVAPSPLQTINSNFTCNPNTSQLYPQHPRGGLPPFSPSPAQLSPAPLFKQNSCDSVEVANHFCDNSSRNSSSKTKDVKNSIVGIGECSSITTNTTNTKSSDMPTTITTTTTQQPTSCRVNNNTSSSNSVSENANVNSQIQVGNSPPPPTHQPPPPPIVPRARPTTLNLQSQKEIRQQLNVQLQQHFQQQQRQQSTSATTTPTTPPTTTATSPHHHQQQQLQPQRPLRKAPLPPLPPKPAQFTNSANSPIHQYHNHPQHLSHNNNNISSHSRSFSNETSSSASSQLTSPTSVGGESEISVNVSLSSPVTTPTHPQHQYNNSQLKSPPIRHRSVITVQPEPPYTRDFLVQSSPTSSSGGSSSQKSFTSVNLTLRQPNSALPHQSTIDISAGPGLGSGGGAGSGGLTYSSTSYDARRGYQKNFQLTVTDEGGVFSASRIRPRSCIYPGENEQDGPVGSLGPGTDGVNPLRSSISEQNVVQQTSQHQQQYPTSPTQPTYHHNYSQPVYQQQQQQQQLQQHPATQYRDTMCQPRNSDGTAEIIERQKTRRDKLATALRDNKKRLNQVLQEMDFLKQPVTPGASERLDCEIQALRSDIQAMLNAIENAHRCGPSIVTWRDNKEPTQTQPFPSSPSRLRPPRPPPPVTLSSSSPRQPQCDFEQRHISTTTTPNSPHHHTAAQPPTYQSIVDPTALLEDEDYSEEELEEDVEPSEMWPCSMCTFRNHPQLNICECCDNIRILPGTINIVSTVGGATGAVPTSTAAGIVGGAPTTSAASVSAVASATNNANSIENDANLTQQQLQQFALHT